MQTQILMGIVAELFPSIGPFTFFHFYSSLADPVISRVDLNLHLFDFSHFANLVSQSSLLSVAIAVVFGMLHVITAEIQCTVFASCTLQVATEVAKKQDLRLR